MADENKALPRPAFLKAAATALGKSPPPVLTYEHLCVTSN